MKIIKGKVIELNRCALVNIQVTIQFLNIDKYNEVIFRNEVIYTNCHICLHLLILILFPITLSSKPIC